MGNLLIEFYKVWDKPEKAEEWRAKLPETETVEQLQATSFKS